MYVGRVRIWNVSVIFEEMCDHNFELQWQRWYNFFRILYGSGRESTLIGGVLRTIQAVGGVLRTIQAAVIFVWRAGAKQGVHLLHTVHSQQQSPQQNPRKQLLFSGE